VKAAPEGLGPRPLTAFFWSLAGSALVLGLLLLSDRRVLQLKRARAEIQELDRRIAESRRENEELSAAIEAARGHDFPAEKAAREELHLVSPEDLVLLYPAGSLTRDGKPADKPVLTPTPR